MRDLSEKIEALSGAGGGGKQPKTRTPVEQPNTLQANMRGRLLDLLAYGPIKGLVDGMKSVYLEDTPVQNSDGTLNFQGLTLTTRAGHVDQEMIEGFRSIENTREINTAVLFDNPPVRSLTNNDSDSVLITVQLAGLARQLDNGDMVAHSVPLAIDMSVNGGAWQTVASDTISGKTTSPFPVTYSIRIPDQGDSFSIRVRRLNRESESIKITDGMTWTLITEVIDARLNYPNMALAAIEVDARLFGNQMPSRAYDVYLSEVKVPSNYNPETREYTGLWDGTFKNAWTDNPAWAFYDLATHPIIGANLQDVDKWSLYLIAQYCDELVSDGYGGMEPRFTINTIFADQDDAIQALNSLASVFRGMAYWGTNTVVPVADMPTAPTKLVSPANVVNGDFEYAGTADKERHSVAVVMWNDPKDFGKSIPEVYEDSASIQQFGWREVRVTAVGCNSRGQAHRLGKWILYSEREETDTLTYQATMDHADLRPGDIIEVADPYRQGARLGGRVTKPGFITIELDQVPTEAVLSVTREWYISLMMPDGTTHRSQVSGFVGNTVHLLTACPQEPVIGGMWALSALGLVLPQYRVASVREDADKGLYTITATEYDPRKYDIVEKDLILPPLPTSLLPTGPLGAPMDLTFETYKYFAGNSDHQGLTISWTPSDDPRVTHYVLDVKAPNDGGFRTVYTGPGVSFDMRDINGGQWTVRVKAHTNEGLSSQWVSRNVQIAILLLPVPPDSVQVTEGTFEVTLWPVSAYPNAVYEFWRSAVPLSAGQIESNATQLPTGTYLVDAGLRANRTYFYYLRGTNQYGLSTWFAVQATTKNDFDDILDAVTEDIVNGDLGQFLNNRIDIVVGEKITDAVEDLQEQIDNLNDPLSYKPEQAYQADQVVMYQGRLYQSLVDVPAAPDGSNAPPKEGMWKDVGEIIADANGLAQQVEKNTTDIEKVGDKVTYQGKSLQALTSAYRDDDGNADMLDAAKGWKTLARVAREEVARASADEALARRTSIVEASVEENTAKVVQVEEALVTEKQATATRFTEVESQVGEANASISELDQALTQEKLATASRFGEVAVSLGENEAAIQAESQARATENEALSQKIDTVEATAGGNFTYRQDAEPTAANVGRPLRLGDIWYKTDADNKSYRYNGSVWQLTDDTRIAQNTAAVQTTSQALATLDGQLKAMYAIKLQLTTDGRTYAAGMGIDITTEQGVTQSQILFQADRMALLNIENGVSTVPWFVESGITYMKAAMIKDGTISFLKIGDDIQSTDYLPGQRGWRLSKGGNIEFNGLVEGGGKLTMTNQLVQVFDSNGTLRVRLGIWA